MSEPPLGIWIDAIIEKLFRFIEMVIVATLVGVGLRPISEPASAWVSGGLAFVAGLYVSLPATRWIIAHAIYRQPKRPFDRWLMLSLLSVAFGLSAVIVTGGLRILLSETFQIDVPAARIDYGLWDAQLHFEDCRHGKVGALRSSATEVQACELHWSSEIHRLTTEKQSLRSRH